MVKVMDHISTSASAHSMVTVPHLYACIWLQAGISAKSAKLLKGQHKGMTAATHQQL